jgi:FkbM family methyltransferase
MKSRSKIIKETTFRLLRFLSRSSSFARIGVLAREVGNRLAGYYLGDSFRPDKNGEYRLLDLLAKHCSTFVDVGAHVGDWSKEFLKRSSAKGVLFEPSQQCAAVLREEFLDTPITFHNLAVGEKSGFISYVEEADFGQTSSALETRHAGPRAGADAAKKIKLVSLDEMFVNTDFNIDFLKIDTEGYDLKVLKGAESLLREGRIRFIQFEYNSHWLGVGSSLKEAIRFLTDLGFDFFLIRGSGLHRFDYDFWGDYFRYSNFLACDQKDRPLLQSAVRERL